MKIVCPECQSDFDVPLALIGAEGRKVKCANCRHVWHTSGHEPDLPPVESPYSAPVDRISPTAYEIDFDLYKSQAQPEKTSFKAALGPVKPAKKTGVKKETVVRLGVALGVCAVLTGALYGLKGPMTSLFPATAPFYRGLGASVTPPGEGVGIDRLTLRASQTGKGRVIELSTKLLNLSDHTVNLPRVYVERLDEQGNPTKQNWTFKPPQSSLKKDESVPFVQKLDSIPADIENIQLRARFAS